MQLISRPTKRWKRKGSRQTRRAPGVALVFVLTTIAILTAVAVDFSYNSRVNLELAAQSRDSLRARSLAMSGMNMARLLLHFQKQIDVATSGPGGQFLSSIIQMLGVQDPTALAGLLQQGNLGPGMNPQAILSAVTQNFSAPTGTQNTGALTAPVGSQTGGGPSIQLWKVSEQFDANTVFNFLNAFPAPADKKLSAPPPPRGGVPGSEAEPIEANFGEFSGSFSIKITDEDQKINVARLGGLATSNAPLATVLQLKPMLDDPSYDFIFNREDRNRDRVERNDVLTSIRDWVDEDEQQTGFDPTVSTGSPFVAGAGDENGPYSRYKPRYKAKNARLDTTQELYQVYGINDAFMAAFGDRLTVYPDINAKLNVNTNDLDQLRSNVLAVARNPLDPILQNPMLYQILQMQINLRRRMLPFIGLTVQEFLGLVQADGVQLNPDLTTPGSPKQFLDNRSTTFRIVSTGEAGRVKKTLTAVVKYDDGLGQLLYWHEE